MCSSEQGCSLFLLRRIILFKNIDKVIEVITPLVHARGDELVDIEYVKENNQNYLRIYVDREPNGIDIDEIATLSESVSEQLDLINPDPLPDPYILELSSPGVERPIKTEADWCKAKNDYVHVGLYKKINGQKSYEGTLLDYDMDKIILEIKIKTQPKKIAIPRNMIANIRFAIKF
jgi:ribosome maturation factor rimP